ncbi:arabinogalactan endo-1,4-beta-galactosidase A like protein [Zymoseptoria brevis]|uniref:Arabinogalactan endo-beta-1,4-galactanase n=1 Tax=Zymoseptoria brevis TaxID=1047168 RepID=A0A0F4GIU1_9PEZI|nr:arabinogalactan endo-1,4-beta-galactosidase A like protein [Zymoseptoria brevis]
MRSTLLWSLLAWPLSAVYGEPFFYAGHDLSSLKIMTDGGAIYKDTSRGNATRPAEDILGDGGMNTVRLRLWVNPVVPCDGGYYESYDLQNVKAVAKRYHDKGFKIYLDFHFADYWADPGKQAIPAAWPKEVGPLADTLREYVSSTLEAFYDDGIDLAIVSLGNELEHGMLWPIGFVNITAELIDLTNLSVLYKAAREGVNDACAAGVPEPSVMIHLPNGWDEELQLTWYDHLTAKGIVQPSDWDLFDVSMYDFYGGNATLLNLETTLNAMALKYRKPILLMADTGISFSAQGQLHWVGAIVKIVKDISYGLGQGIFYWGPAWLNSTSLGGPCQDLILFDADFSGPNAVAWSRSSVNMFAGL